MKLNRGTFRRRKGASFAFGAITRDKYYNVHGQKSAMPRVGNYEPKFNSVERYPYDV